MRFFLYRAKVQLPTQVSLFEAPPANLGSLLRDAILEQAQYNGREGSIWIVRNARRIGDSVITARFGRSRRELVERLGHDGFYEEEDERYPNTRVIVEWPLEIVAIKQNSNLSTNMRVLANSLENALSNTHVMRKYGARVLISEIFDSKQFVERVRQARRVTWFAYEVRRPNLDDVDEDFLDPLERAVEQSDGSKARVEISEEKRGKSLNKEVVARVGAAVAATGEICEAEISDAEGRRPIKVSTAGTHVQISRVTLEGDDDLIQFVEAMRSAIAGPNGNSKQTKESD